MYILYIHAEGLIISGIMLLYHLIPDTRSTPDNRRVLTLIEVSSLE